MRARNSKCNWRSITSAGAISLMAISAVTMAAPRTSVRKVLPPRTEPVNVDKPNLSIELDGQELEAMGVPRVIYDMVDDASYARGDVAAGGSSTATVYQDYFDEGVGFFGVLNSAETGNYHESWFQFENWAPGGSVTGYEVLVFNSTAASGTAVVRMSLWDGDPLGFFDTTCSAGGVPALIPGTTALFTDIPQGFIGFLTVNLGGKAVVNCTGAHMVMELLGGCRLAWRIGGDDSIGPDVGFCEGISFLYSADETEGPAFCCDDSSVACVASDPTVPCARTGAGATGHCTDGIVDSIGYSLSDLTSMPPYYAGMVAAVFAATDLRIYGLPVSGDQRPGLNPPAVGWSISGNEIKMAKGNRPVWVDWFVTDWDASEDNDDTGATANKRVKAYQLWLDSAAYTSGLAGTLTPHRPACANNAACSAAIGSGVSSECVAAQGNTCNAGIIDASRADYMFRGIDTLAAVDNSTPEIRWGAAGQNQAASIWKCNGGVANGKVCNVSNCPDPNAPCNLDCPGIPAVIPDGLCQPNHADRYLGTGAFYVSADAKGTFELLLRPLGQVGGGSDLLDDNSQPFPFVAIEPPLITVEIGQCCDLSVQPFTCLSDTGTANECAAAGGNFQPGATCADPCGCNLDEQCDDSNPCTADVCSLVNNQCENTPIHDPAVTCCDPADGALAAVDDGNDCTDDLCDEGTGQVSHTPVADGSSCDHPSADDDAECDNADTCLAGVCQDNAEPNTTPCGDSALQCFYNLCDGNGVCDEANDLEVGGYPCASDADCTALGPGASTATCDLGTGECSCIACFTNLPCSDPLACRTDVTLTYDGDNCFDTGEKVTAEIAVGASLKPLNAGQFFITYDADCLDFNSITVVAPFTTVLAQQVNEAAGTIFWAVGLGLDPNTGEPLPCNLGDQSFGTISFTKLGSCNSCGPACFGGTNPQETFLSACHSEGQNDGGYVCADTTCSKELGSNVEVAIDVPDDMKVNSDCDQNTATVSWPAPTASSSCGTASIISCTGEHESGYDLDSLCMGGGELPIGTSTFCATASSGGACSGGDAMDCWTVTVNEQTSLDVDVQLSPIILANAMSRCIQFELYSDCVQPPFVFSQELLFGGLFDHVGQFSADVKIPDSGKWICITARDKQHTLRACDTLACVGGVYEAVFKGDPFFGGNWLVGGNLDGWKKTNPNASHDAIDILDFGQYVAEWGNNYGGVNSDCDTINTPNADINGDGAVDGLDFAFISLNFGDTSKDCCCPGSVAGNRTVRTEVSVIELRQMGMGELAVADLDGNGLVNTDDMAAFMAGATPKDKGRDSGRKGGNVRASR